MPSGKPGKLSSPAVVPAWPPRPDRSTRSVSTSLARRVNGRRQPGRPSSHDDQVVVLAPRLRAETELCGQLGVGGLDQDPAVGEDDGGDDALSLVDLADVLLSSGVRLDVHSVVRHELLAEELLGPAAVRAPLGSVDGEARRKCRHVAGPPPARAEAVKGGEVRRSDSRSILQNAGSLMRRACAIDLLAWLHWGRRLRVIATVRGAPSIEATFCPAARIRPPEALINAWAFGPYSFVYASRLVAASQEPAVPPAGSLVFATGRSQAEPNRSTLGLRG